MKEVKINHEQTEKGRFHEPRWFCKWGEYSKALEQYADMQEEQINLRDEKLIQKNEEIMNINKALDEALKKLEEIAKDDMYDFDVGNYNLVKYVLKEEVKGYA